MNDCSPAEVTVCRARPHLSVKTLADQLRHPAWLVRHVALCRLVFGRPRESEVASRIELSAALQALGNEVRNGGIVQLLQCQVALIDLERREQAERSAAGLHRGQRWSTLERELEAANLRETALACLRDHGRRAML